MPYVATWTNGNFNGRLEPAEHFIRDDDAAELAAAVNRRRRLIYLPEQDFSEQIAPGLGVRAATVALQEPPPFKNFRGAVAEDILVPALGGLGGDPATPAGMEWLWPVGDQDENKVIVVRDAGAGQVALMEKLNGGDDWTDPAIGAGAGVRTVHFNELRQSVECISRGRWRLPIYFSGGIFSLLPDTPWIGDSIANNGADELRSIGLVLARTADAPPLGLTGVTVRSSTRLIVTADLDCQVQLFHCLRPIDYLNDPPTWNQYAPLADLDWSTPGGMGAGDADEIGTLDLTAGVPGEISCAALVSAVQALIDGAEQNVLIRRGNTGYETIGIAGELVVEFDLDSPPN